MALSTSDGFVHIWRYNEEKVKEEMNKQEWNVDYDEERTLPGK